MLGQSLASWIALPIVAVLLALGLALLLERVTGARLGALRVPVGLCTAVCLALAVYALHGTGPIALAVVGVPAIAGLVVERRELLSWRPGWMTLAWLAAYGLHIAPVLLSGEWGWLGYNFVNDTAVQLLLTENLMEHGTALVAPSGDPTSASEYLRIYTVTAYPLGSHSLLATLGEVVRVPVAALYQPYIAVLSASAAVGLAQLARRAGLALPAAAAAGALAAGANLFYQYALQGNVKEVAFFMALVAAAAVGRELIASDRPLRYAAPVAICFAAAFEIYSAAAAPYLLALGAALAAAALWRGRASIKSLAIAGGALLAGALVFAIPALAKVGTFNSVASGTFASDATAADLGHLARPLEISQAAGVWLTGDYRLPVPTGRDWLTTLLIALIVALVVVGVWGAIRRREPAALLLLATTVVSAFYLLPRLSPYADGKVLALASPIFVLGAAIGAWEIARRRPRLRPVAAVLAAAMLIGVLWSDAYAYHVVKVSPIDRLEALDDINRTLTGVDGLVMLNEPEEYGKVFDGDGAPINAVTESIGKWVQLREPRGFSNLYFDLDEQTLASVEDYPAIVKRHSPDASRPPANYRLAHSNDWYEAWVREDSPTVVEHLPLQGLKRATAVPRCKDVRALAAKARRGDVLVAAARPPELRLDPLKVPRPAGWPPHPWQEDMVVTLSPGAASGRVNAEQGGRYRVWVAGGFGRPIEVSVDGKRIGAASGVNNVGQWLPAGEVELEAGTHRLEMERPGGGLGPSNGYIGELGPVVLEPVEPKPSLERFAPADARQLCGRPWDWIELVRGA